MVLIYLAIEHCGKGNVHFLAAHSKKVVTVAIAFESNFVT